MVMLRRVLLSLTVALTLVGAGLLPVGTAAQAATSPAVTATTAAATAVGGWGRSADYLALGDSVPFGYNPLIPLVPPPDPAAYVGYPELAAPALQLRVTNLSCPGQTTQGFLTLKGSDNGCFDFRHAAKLHAPYDGTQLHAALTFLKTHRSTRLVTIMLGANDLLLCQQAAGGCTEEAAKLALATAGTNLTEALAAIRSVYHGPLIGVTYYSTDYADQTTTGTVYALDSVLSDVTKAYGGQVADGFTAFQQASAGFKGNACAAGLLIPLPGGECDKHPTRRGAALLAVAVIHAAYAVPQGAAA
jgi:hypothetical protein